MSRTTQNAVVILAALSAALVVVQSQTNWLSVAPEEPMQRERCFGVSDKGGNDCATPKHSCAAQSTKARDSSEWIMLPEGLCDRLVGGKAESL